MENSDEEIGPMPEPRSSTLETSGAQAFREREARLEVAKESAVSKPASQRPDWMLDMPEDRGMQAILGAPLRSRGFQQGGAGARVQRSGGTNMSNSEATQARRLWTETPQERLERIRKAGGVDVEEVEEDESDRLARKRASRRDAQIRAQANALNEERGPSLVEQHKVRRIEERSTGHTTHSKRDVESDRDRERRYRHRDRDSEHRREHQRRHGHHRDDHWRGELRHRHRSSRRSRSSTPPRKTRAEREAEDLQNNPSFTYFDKDKVLGAGSRLMDERSRSRTIKDATQLTSRFSAGDSGSFL